MRNSKQDVMEQVWKKSLPRFTKDQIQRGMHNALIKEMKDYWTVIRNTEHGRELVVRQVEAGLRQLHMNLMIDHGATQIKCDSLNSGRESHQSIIIRASVETRHGDTISLDMELKPLIL